ncbi:hypothetical protein [uncultured Desulfovibrio sp.]|uniref:hypothetical protein n=1 Tax=uncultured Desulfovibrio sp. TaxID=167968 RepID=UPI00258E68F6|nr:hypothetical protein [uncultured Desulfovibrio sp.]
MAMALPIQATPTLTGKDAKRFWRRFNNPALRRKPEPVDAKKVLENVMRVMREQKQL